MNWGEIPDLIAIVLLICAFASTARRDRTHLSGIWLTGWLMIALHFFAFLFLYLPGSWGILAALTGSVALVWAGILFQTAVVSFRKALSSRLMMLILLGTNALYMILLIPGHSPAWALNAAAALFGIGPLAITLFALRSVNAVIRWYTVALYLALSAFLLTYQNRPGIGTNLALYAVLFVVYLNCSVIFFFAYRRATAGAFITIAGFLAWASVFAIAPWLQYALPQIHVESEVWNLPKFVVAAGMLLLLLENQIEHNKHLAQHDALTGLPNRRLFQDRLASALDRSRRNNSISALLLLDLNRFKQVNDTLGHHVGDLLLMQVGEVLSRRVRRSDTVARTGGDEFSVILEQPASREEALHVGQELVHLVCEPMLLAGHKVQIGASIGIAIFPDDAENMNSLCIVADQLMYMDKHGSSVIGSLLPARESATTHSAAVTTTTSSSLPLNSN